MPHNTVRIDQVAGSCKLHDTVADVDKGAMEDGDDPIYHVVDIHEW